MEAEAMKQTYQTYGLDADGGLVHAGPHDAEENSLKVARRLHRAWMHWRRAYRKDHPGWVPACRKPVRWMVVHLLGRPEEAIYYNLKTGESHQQSAARTA